MRVPVSIFCVLALFLIGFTTPVFAHTATRFLHVEVVDLADTGDASSISGVLLLESLFKDQTFVVTLQYATPDHRGEKPIAENRERVVLEPGGRAKIPFSVGLAEDGKHQVGLDLVVVDENGAFLGVQTHMLYFLVEDGKYRRASYEELYVPKSGRSEKGQPPGIQVGSVTPASKDERVVPPPEDARGVLGVKRLKPHALPGPSGSRAGRIDDPSRVKPQFDRDLLKRLRNQLRLMPKDIDIDIELPRRPPVRGGTGPRVEPYGGGGNIEEEMPDGLQRDSALSVPPPAFRTTGTTFLDGLRRIGELLSPVTPAHAQQGFTVSGRFSFRGLDNQLHPGWNWYVQLWWRKSNGSWEKLAGRYIPPSGNWSLTFSKSGYSGQHLRILYRAGGYYILPQDRDGNEYWWADPDQTNIPGNFSIGHRVADTSNSGTLAGLGDVYRSAIRFWNKFTINNVNPERADPIRLFYPNTWDDCGAGTGSPWSCASVGGDIWLIPAHSDDYTIQHELSHQLNNEYWNNQRPPGAGGPHTLSQCYNTGLALREGFANAVPHWVLDGENDPDPDAGGFELEAPDDTVICNGDTNEVWVAGVFWDLLDRHSDGQDILWFNNAVEVFTIYLNAGVKNGIKNYRSNYRNAASTGHEGFIDDIYENNTISVP